MENSQNFDISPVCAHHVTHWSRHQSSKQDFGNGTEVTIHENHYREAFEQLLQIITDCKDSMTLLMPTSHLPSVRNAAETVFMALGVEQYPRSIVGRGKRIPGIRQYICYFNARRHPQRVPVPIILRVCGAKNCFNMIRHRQLGDEVRPHRPTR
ncbi:hypothetical protein L207DRAFT_347973 [Hyaloscypha variabilis F]|jgi:hypothetical protein|uniref:Uncharacterized protein n=1 Tax=Hyaloscypha variabilis (strain UAMH 11265 / GT02V1 / F) TaxID=1149755 RepID=A0A2J6RR43_HYAVF|nr:hypothetical protein L207DRAFT_347973 [Hyaloscypha variabilis F]